MSTLSDIFIPGHPPGVTTNCGYDAIYESLNATQGGSTTESYTYDAINRLTQKSFNDGSTPTVKYGYDGTALTGCTTAPPTLTDSNPVGRRTAMCDGIGAESWSHDSMGGVLQHAHPKCWRNPRHQDGALLRGRQRGPVVLKQLEVVAAFQPSFIGSVHHEILGKVRCAVALCRCHPGKCSVSTRRPGRRAGDSDTRLLDRSIYWPDVGWERQW